MTVHLTLTDPVTQSMKPHFLLWLLDSIGTRAYCVGYCGYCLSTQATDL